MLYYLKTDQEQHVLFQVLEHLYCEKWSSADGLVALIISPTRELAYQIFEVLRKVGKYHDFSAGLVIGGKVCCIYYIVDITYMKLILALNLSSCM